MDSKYEAKKPLYEKKRREKIKEQRGIIKESKANGDTSSNKLHFFQKIIEQMGLSQSDFAKAVGDSPQRVSWLFSTADDTRLSYIQESLEKLGVTITPSYVQKNSNVTLLDTDDVQVVGFLPMIGRGIGRATYLDDCISNKGRLLFLAQFVKESGLTISQFCKKASIDPSSMRFMFERDDTKVSMLLKIAKAFDCKLNWKVDTLRKD